MASNDIPSPHTQDTLDNDETITANAKMTLNIIPSPSTQEILDSDETVTANAEKISNIISSPSSQEKLLGSDETVTANAEKKNEEDEDAFQMKRLNKTKIPGSSLLYKDKCVSTGKKYFEEVLKLIDRDGYTECLGNKDKKKSIFYNNTYESFFGRMGTFNK